ncbi:hypothetical protein BN949_04558 [Agrobacterium tumefaciens]|nr:hypothetical protein RP007_04811 [Rhizobium sp. P007]CDN95386.1 hypothetical protein BN949_04558 [Agrobacterium tumefaciens]
MTSMNIHKLQTVNMSSADYTPDHEIGRDGEIPA